MVMETAFSAISKAISPRRNPVPMILSLFTVFLLWSCTGGGTKNAASDSAVDSVGAYTQDESYHADNDIAMTIRSVADALNQGEELDSIDYNYEGILTDGTGHPLYTDVQGTPGVWSIRVVEPYKLTISNLYLGDLLPIALEAYLTQSLGLDESNIVKDNGIEPDDADSVHVYAFKGGFLIFKTRTAITPKGYEGPLMTIIATGSLPSKKQA